MPQSPIPLMPGPWRPLAPGHAAGFALRLAALLAQPRSHEALAPHHRVTGLRAMPLSFYPGWALVEGEALVEPGLAGTFDVLYGPGLMWLIDGESRMLNDLNAGCVPRDLERHLNAGPDQGAGDAGAARAQAHDPAGFIASPLRGLDDPATGADFLRFYCACVWGEEGPFMPVESADSPALRGFEARDAVWLGRLRPLTLTRDGEDLIAEGVIAYGRSLFEARLRVRDGGVRMEDDAPIAADVLPERINAAPLRDLRRTQE
jgi:hypothetical protein